MWKVNANFEKPSNKMLPHTPFELLGTFFQHQDHPYLYLDGVAWQAEK